jgi:hypothetical protein
MSRTLAVLGAVLVLGGIGHSAGVGYLYLTAGRPEANRVMLDVWVAQAQLLGGGLYLGASRAARAGVAWRPLAFFGALTIIGFTVSVLPVLFSRAPVAFRIPAIIYLFCSVLVLIGLQKTKGHTTNEAG